MPDPKKVVARFQLEAMSNLRPNKTGVVGAIIWVSAGEFSGVESQHGPRIKVVPGTKITTDGLRDAISISITEPPKVFGDLTGEIEKQALRFVRLNQDVLLRYWRNEIDTAEMLEGLVH